MTIKIAVEFDNTTDDHEGPVTLTEDMISFGGEADDHYRPESIEDGRVGIYVIEEDDESAFFEALENDCNWCFTGSTVLMDPDPYPITAEV